MRNCKEQPNRNEEYSATMKNPLNRIKKIPNDTEKLMSELQDRGVESHCSWMEKKEKKWDEIKSPLKQHQLL